MSRAEEPPADTVRVAMVCPYSLSRPGGVQGQAVGLARALGTLGHRATVFAPLDDPADAPADVDVEATGRSVPVRANGSRAPVAVSPRAARNGAAAIRAGGFDVVHVHEPFAPGLPWALLAGHGLPPLVATFHRRGDSPFYRGLRPLTTKLAAHLAVRCAVSEAAAATAAAAVGGEYVTLFNGVDAGRYAAAEPWPTGGPTVLFLGRHEARKGLRVLLEAFGDLRKTGAADGPAPHLWIAGDGPERGRLRRAYPPSDRVEWLGVLSEDEKLRRLAGADVLCAPSISGESFGVVLLEAMAAGTAVVASDIDGYRAAAGDCAVLVPPGDPVRLSAALADALAPGPAADERRHRGRLRADEWSMPRLAHRYLDVYRAAVAAGPA